MANKAQGKGFENESHYSNMKFYFFAIENIHVMRSSLQKLIEGMYFFLFTKWNKDFSISQTIVF